MKKNILKLLTGCALASLLFTSCFNAVFYEIEQDVLPEDSTITGNITSIVRYTVADTEYLVVPANGTIMYKLASNEEHGGWHSYDSSKFPFELHHYDYYGAQDHVGQQIIKIVADSEYLYVETCSYYNNTTLGTACPDVVYLYGLKISEKNSDGTWVLPEASSWTKILGDNNNILYTYSYGDYYYSAFNVYCTNAVQKNHRLAFVRSGSYSAAVDSFNTPVNYALSDGKNVVLFENVTINGASLKNAGALESYLDSSVNSELNSAAILGDTTLVFFNSIAVTTNETSSKNATRFYYGNGSSLYYNKTEGNFTDGVEKALDASITISCLAACNDSLLIGRADYGSTSTSASGGIQRTTLANGVPGTTLVDFETNALSQLSSNYFILTLLNVDPSKNETASCIYSSISFLGSGSSTSVNYSNIGLWSYYPARGNWNRE